jgi:hypothetical protein
MAPRNKGKVGNSAPTKKKKGTQSTVSTTGNLNAQAKAKSRNNRKRRASDLDESTSDDSSESSDASAHPKRKPRKRKKAAEVQEDIPDTEEVNDESSPEAGGNDNVQVSCYIYTFLLLWTYQLCRVMTRMMIVNSLFHNS